MGINPVNDHALLEPILHSEIRAADIKRRTGLYVAKPDNKLNSFEGVPNQGVIYALPADYSGRLKVGMRVVFSETSPKGFKYDDRTLFPIALDKIIAEVANDTEESS